MSRDRVPRGAYTALYDASMILKMTLLILAGTIFELEFQSEGVMKKESRNWKKSYYSLYTVS